MRVDQLFRVRAEQLPPERWIDEDTVVDGYRVGRLLFMEPWRQRVYEAIAPDGRQVALKVAGLRSSDGRQARRRFRRLVRLRASIEHPHLLPVLGSGRLGADLYLVMELSRAPTLADVLEGGGVGDTSALRLLGQAAEGLEAADARGLLHLDLSPKAIIVAPGDGGHALLGDFGVGKPEWGSQTWATIESPDYVSPEELRSEPLELRSNVYSLACILVECLTGRPPYISELPDTVVYGHLLEPPPRPTERRPELPREIDEVVALGMAKEPERRLDSPRDLVRAAAEALGVSGALPGDFHGTAPKPRRRPRGQRRSPAPALATRARRRIPRLPRPELRRRASSTFALPGRARYRFARAPRAEPWREPLYARARRRIADAPRPELGRNALVLTLALTAVAAGTAGFVVARGGNHPAGQDRSHDPRRLSTERYRYLQAADPVIEQLSRRRVAVRGQLASARTPATQARKALLLAGAYRGTYRALPAPAPAGARGGGLSSALRRAEQAYLRMAAAAWNDDRRGYDLARRAVARSERGLEREFVHLRRPNQAPSTGGRRPGEAPGRPRL